MLMRLISHDTDDVAGNRLRNEVTALVEDGNDDSVLHDNSPI